MPPVKSWFYSRLRIVRIIGENLGYDEGPTVDVSTSVGNRHLRNSCGANDGSAFNTSNKRRAIY